MNCCYIQNLLSAFIDNELDLEKRRQIRNHLHSCPECTKEYQQLLSLKSCLTDLETNDYEFDLISNLQVRINFEADHSCREKERFVWFKKTGMVFACVGVFFVITFILFPPSHSPETNYTTNLQSPTEKNPVAYDQSISLDYPVTIYQAATTVILP